MSEPLGTPEKIPGTRPRLSPVVLDVLGQEARALGLGLTAREEPSGLVLIIIRDGPRHALLAGPREAHAFLAGVRFSREGEAPAAPVGGLLSFI